MHRRSLLAALAVGATGAVAGCSGLAGPIVDRSLEICDTDCDWKAKTPDAGGDPVVERDPAERLVAIYGHMFVGSSSCDRAVLETAELRNEILRVVVGVGNRGNNPVGGDCTADMSADRYRVTVRLRDAMPEQVVVEEDAVYHPEPSETGTDG